MIFFFSAQQADGGLWLVSPSQTSCRGMTSFQSVKQTCDHGQMPDGWKKCWSSPHDECLALAASITYHMYQLPDRKVWLQVGSVTQGNYIVQFLVMPPYSGAERKNFFLSLASFTVQRDLLIDGVDGKSCFKGRTPGSVQGSWWAGNTIFSSGDTIFV